MIRSSAKNHKYVAVVVEPSDYKKVMDEIQNSGEVSQKTRNDLAVKAYKHTAEYDTEISKYLARKYSE
jgi:phosphoribosylaminoimidazolecarboxamide formyltransferase/IMP cyclohydrolase